VVLAGGSPESRASLAAALADLDFVALVDPPGLTDLPIGADTVFDEIERAAGVLFVVDELPLPDSDLDLLVEVQKVTGRVVFVAENEPRLPPELPRFAGAPCFSRTNLPGLRDELRDVAVAGRLYRQSQALHEVRSAAILRYDVLRERLGAVRRDEAHLARIRKQLAAAATRAAALETSGPFHPHRLVAQAENRG
jgi:hypothetical protein